MCHCPSRFPTRNTERTVRPDSTLAVALTTTPRGPGLDCAYLGRFATVGHRGEPSPGRGGIFEPLHFTNADLGQRKPTQAGAGLEIPTAERCMEMFDNIHGGSGSGLVVLSLVERVDTESGLDTPGALEPRENVSHAIGEDRLVVDVETRPAAGEVNLVRDSCSRTGSTPLDRTQPVASLSSQDALDA